jgi:hypothetical protein
LAPYCQAIGLGVVVLGITYLSLILGELVPKQLALVTRTHGCCGRLPDASLVPDRRPDRLAPDHLD